MGFSSRQEDTRGKKMKGNEGGDERGEIEGRGENKSIIKMTRKEERERGCWMVGGGKWIKGGKKK